MLVAAVVVQRFKLFFKTALVIALWSCNLAVLLLVIVLWWLAYAVGASELALWCQLASC